MTKANYTTGNQHFKHLSDIQRGKLEQLAKCGTYTQAEIVVRSISHLYKWRNVY